MYTRFILPFTTVILILCLFTSIIGVAQNTEREFYELKKYHIENTEQERQVDTFLENAYLPALSRAGIKNVGVFKPIEDSPAYGKNIYVFIPYSSADQFITVRDHLENDTKLISQGSEYLKAPHDKPPYQRIETVLMKAFDGMPNHKVNNLNGPEKIYELRSYEGATEMLSKKKIEMFNNGEIDIFKRLGFNPMFFGEVIAGSKMPNLMYMTTFDNIASRKSHWKDFRHDKEWEKMKVMEEYKNTVSHIDITLLHPTSYSGL